MFCNAVARSSAAGLAGNCVSQTETRRSIWWDALDPHARSRFRVGVVAIIIIINNIRRRRRTDDLMCVLCLAVGCGVVANHY